MTYALFAGKVEKAGLTPRECMSDHWQIHGGKHLVNVWPHSRRGFRIQLHGQKSRRGSVEAAIKLAEPPDQPPKADESPPWEPGAEPAKQQVGIIRRFWRWVW